MNIRNVLSTYKKLRDLTDDETALLETLRAMSDAERELTVEALQPAKPTAKKAGKKAASKSSRASNMAATLKNSLESQRRVTKDGACSFVLESGVTCNTGDNNPIHDKSMGYAGYHEFQAATSAAAHGD